jgi:hypothetical protein
MGGAWACGRPECRHPNTSHRALLFIEFPVAAGGRTTGVAGLVLAVACEDCPPRTVGIDTLGHRSVTQTCPMGNLQELHRRFGEIARERGMPQPVALPTS